MALPVASRLFAFVLAVSVGAYTPSHARSEDFVQGPPTSAAPPPRACKVLHLQIRGDLDSMRLAQEFAGVLDAARTDNVEVIVLELSGNRWRQDVVHAMAKAMRSGSPNAPPQALGRRVFAILDDAADRRVGFGQASIAFLADACAVAQGVTISHDADDDLRLTAPPDTDWERVERELHGLVYLAAKDRGGDVMITGVLPNPRGPLWSAPAADPGSPWRVLTSKPAEGTWIQLIPETPEGRVPSLRFDSTLASRLGIATCDARDTGQLLARHGLRARPILRKELTSGLADARARIRRTIEQLDDVLRATEIDLKQAARLRGQDAPRQKRDAGARGLRMVEEARRHLLDAEALMIDYPELLATLPPDRTPVGQDASKHPMLWRYRFQDLRDLTSELEAQAQTLTKTP